MPSSGEYAASAVIIVAAGGIAYWLMTKGVAAAPICDASKGLYYDSVLGACRCREGYHWNGSQCVPDTTQECTVDSECPVGEVCENGSCVPEPVGPCQSDVDCPPGYVCLQGVCTPTFSVTINVAGLAEGDNVNVTLGGVVSVTSGGTAVFTGLSPGSYSLVVHGVEYNPVIVLDQNVVLNIALECLGDADCPSGICWNGSCITGDKEFTISTNAAATITIQTPTVPAIEIYLGGPGSVTLPYGNYWLIAQPTDNQSWKPMSKTLRVTPELDAVDIVFEAEVTTITLTLRVEVQDECANTPIPNALVEVWLPDGTVVKEITDINGVIEVSHSENQWFFWPMNHRVEGGTVHGFGDSNQSDRTRIHGICTDANPDCPECNLFTVFQVWGDVEAEQGYPAHPDFPFLSRWFIKCGIVDLTGESGTWYGSYLREDPTQAGQCDNFYELDWFVWIRDDGKKFISRSNLALSLEVIGPFN